MSEAIKDGGPAFPTQTYEYDGRGNVLQYQIGGMTLRDYFAAKAIMELRPLCSTNKSAAQEAYKIADAMLEAREVK